MSSISSGRACVHNNFLASDIQVANETGGYFVKKKKTHSSKISESIDLQKKLWDTSEEIFQRLCK